MTEDEPPSLVTYVINLDRSPERMQAIRDAFGDLPWPLVRVPALDAAQRPQDVLDARGLVPIDPPNGVGWHILRFRMFALVEEACLSSHMVALRQFLATNHTHALMLEDDACPKRSVGPEIQRIVDLKLPFDVIKLEGIRHRGSRLAIRERDLGSATLVHPFRPSSGSAAYLVSRAGAKRLLDHVGRRLIPFDDYLNNGFLYGARVLHVSPWLIRQADAGSTMVDQRRLYRYHRLRDPWHSSLQLARRGALRLILWWRALAQARWRLSGLVDAPW